MRRNPNQYALLLALCAVLLRGLIPLGWMPSAATGTLALCTADGLVQLSTTEARELLGQGVPPAQEHAGPGPCAFAASGMPGAAPAVALPPSLALAGAPEPRYCPPLLPYRPAGIALARAPPLLS